MKLCPQCECGYPDTESTCPLHGKRLSPTRDLPPGLLVNGAYRIQSKLGQGSMGTVYLVEQEQSGKLETVKFLSPELSADESFTTRFERAAKRLSELHHPNVLASGNLEHAEDDSLFFAMEYVDGPSLRALLDIAPDPFDASMALAITRCVAEGLGAAHANGMIHLDLRPESILIARDAKSIVPKIANFGIGATRENGSTFLAAGRILLTPTYAAPEQWLDTRSEHLDGRTDLYALGGILFEMLTGETVFDVVGYHAWARQHLTVPPRMPSELRPELAGWYGLDGLVLALLAKDADDRPKDAAAVLALLDAVQFGARILPSPPADFVEVGISVQDDREQEVPPAAEPAQEPEAAVELPSASTSIITEMVAEEVPVIAPEAPVSFSHAFTDGPADVEPEVELTAPEPPTADPVPFVAEDAEVELAATPEPPPEAFPPVFPVELTAPVNEPFVAPSERLTIFFAPESVEEPVAAEETFRITDFEFPPPEPESVAPAEDKPVSIAEPELPTTFTASEVVEEVGTAESVEEPFAPEPLEEPVVDQTPPYLSDPEFAPQEPEFLPPAEPEPVQKAEPELPSALTAPDQVEEPVVSEAVEEPVAPKLVEESVAQGFVEERAVDQEPPHLSDPEFPPPEPKSISPVEPEPVQIAEPELPTDFTAQEPVEQAVVSEAVEEPIAPEPAEESALADEPPHLSDPEFRPSEPKSIPSAEAEPFHIAEYHLPSAFTAQEPVEQYVVSDTTEEPIASEPGEEPVAPNSAEESALPQEPPPLSDPEFPPSESQFTPTAEGEQVLTHQSELPSTFIAPEPVQEPVESESVEEPFVAQEPPRISDPEFPPPVLAFIPLAEPEPSPIPSPEPTISFTRQQHVFEPATSGPAGQPTLSTEAPRSVDSKFMPPEPEFLPPAPPEPPPFIPPPAAPTFTAPKPVEEPFVAPPRRFFAPEFPPTEPEFIRAPTPEPHKVFTPATPEQADGEESPMDIEELKRLFGRKDTGVKPDDPPRRTTNTTSIFGPQSTGLGREEWPDTAAPTNFFGKPYKPAAPEAPPAQTPDFSAAFSRPIKTDWIDSGKSADPSTLRAAVGTVSPFPGATSVPEIDFRREPEEDEEESHYEEHHPLRTVLIVVVAILLLAAVGFAIWRLVINDANEPVTKMNAGCAQGDGKACYDLGAFYEQTNTVSDGDERAAAIYSQSCELNYPLACRKLGLKYLLGTGIARDNPKAINFFAKGCDKADAESCDNLANIYHEGKGVPLNDAKAAEFYAKACSAGDDFGCKWANQLAPPPPPAKSSPKPSPKRPAPAANSHKAQ